MYTKNRQRKLDSQWYNNEKAFYKQPKITMLNIIKINLNKALHKNG